MVNIKDINPSKPDLVELLYQLKLDISKNINAVNIGIIEEFNPDNQTATIRMAIKQVQNIFPDGSKLYQEHPLLLVCPIVVLYGGGTYLSFPIAPGDNCLVLFNDREIDQWFQNGGVQAPISSRTHDISDGFALVGINSLQSSITNYLINGIRLQQSSACKIELTPDLISTVGALFMHTGDMLITGGLTINGLVKGHSGTLTLDDNVVQTPGKTLSAGNGATGTFNVVNVVDGIVTGGS